MDVYGRFGCMYVDVSHVYVVLAEIRRGHQIPPELEFQMVMNSTPLGTESTQVPLQEQPVLKTAEPSLHSSPSTSAVFAQSHLASPLPYFLFSPTFLIFMSIDNQAVYKLS